MTLTKCCACNIKCLDDVTAVLEIAAGHWPFSDQFQHLLVYQISVHFHSYIQKTADLYSVMLIDMHGVS